MLALRLPLPQNRAASMALSRTSRCLRTTGATEPRDELLFHGAGLRWAYQARQGHFRFVIAA